MVTIDCTICPAETDDSLRPTRDRVDRRIGGLLFLCLLCVYLLTSRGGLWSIDAAMRIGVAETLIEEGKVGYPSDCQRILRQRGGKLIWGIGHSITLIPSVVAGKLAPKALPSASGGTRYRVRKLVREAGCAFTNAVFGALTCVLLFAFGRLLKYSRRTCVLAALGLGLATTWWQYTQDGRYEILQGLLILFAFYAWLRHLRGHGLAWAVWTGAAAGLALLTKLPNAILIVALLATLVIARRRGTAPSINPWGSALALLAPFAAFVAVQIWADWSWTGELFPSQVGKDNAYALAMREGDPVAGALAILFGFQHGVLWYAPPLLVSMFLLDGVDRRKSGLAWGILIVLLPLLAIAGQTYPIIGTSWGPRSLLALFPLIALGFLPWLERVRQGQSFWLRTATWSIFSLSFLGQVLATTVQENRYYAAIKDLPAEAVSQFPLNFPLAHRLIEIGDVVKLMGGGSPDPIGTLNYWWALGYFQGVPGPAIMVGVAALLLGAISFGLLTCRLAGRGHVTASDVVAQ